MGLIPSSIHVGNASCKTIRARVAQQEIRITEIDATVGFNGPPISLDASIKAKLDHSLDVTGFARIAPQQALEFALPKGSLKPVYVSVTTADDPSPLVICFNYSPPHGKSVLVTNNATVVLSQKQPGKKIPLRPAQPSDSFKTRLLNYTPSPPRGTQPKEALINIAFETDGTDGELLDANLELLGINGDIRGTDGNLECTDGEIFKAEFHLVLERSDETWATDEGLCYTAGMAKKVFLQSDIDDELANNNNILCKKEGGVTLNGIAVVNAEGGTTLNGTATTS